MRLCPRGSWCSVPPGSPSPTVVKGRVPWDYVHVDLDVQSLLDPHHLVKGRFPWDNLHVDLDVQSLLDPHHLVKGRVPWDYLHVYLNVQSLLDPHHLVKGRLHEIMFMCIFNVQSGFLPSFFYSTKWYSWIDSTFLVRIFKPEWSMSNPPIEGTVNSMEKKTQVFCQTDIKEFCHHRNHSTT